MTTTELPGSSADPSTPDTPTPDTNAASTATSATQRSAEEAQPVPARAEGLELLGAIPGSGYRQAPSLVRRRDGQTLQLTPLLYAVLEAIDGERSYPEIAERVSERIGKIAGADDVQYLAEKKLKPLGVLQGADGAVPAAQKANPLLSLKPRVVITDPDRTRRITHPFALLFAPFVVVPLVAAFLAASGWLVVKKGLASATHQAFYQPGLLLVVF